MKSHVLKAVDEFLALNALRRDPALDALWEERDAPVPEEQLKLRFWPEQHKEALVELRKIALDTALAGVGLYVNRPFMRDPKDPRQDDRLRAVYDLVDPRFEPEMAAALLRVRRAHDELVAKDEGPDPNPEPELSEPDPKLELFARTIVDLWRVAEAPCRNPRKVSKDEAVGKILTGAETRKQAAENLSAACRVLPTTQHDMVPIEVVAGVVDWMIKSPGETDGEFKDRVKEKIEKWSVIENTEQPVEAYFDAHDYVEDENTLLVLFEAAKRLTDGDFQWETVTEHESYKLPKYVSWGELSTNRRLKYCRSDDAHVGYDFVYLRDSDGIWTRKELDEYLDEVTPNDIRREDFDPDAEFNEQFWKSPSSLYYVTAKPEEALENGDSYFWAWDDGEMPRLIAHEYDRKILELDLSLMKVDYASSELPRVRRSEEATYKEEMDNIAYALGRYYEDQHGRVSDEEDDPSAIYVMGSVPAKYIFDPDAPEPEEEPEDEGSS